MDLASLQPGSSLLADLSTAREAGEVVAVISGTRFMVADNLGDAVPGGHHGLFASDTRFLSTYVLRLNGARPRPLTARNSGHDAASFYATMAPRHGSDQGAVTLQRDRAIDGQLIDEIVLHNHSAEDLALDLSLAFGADFLDIFEVRSPAPPRLPVSFQSMGPGARLAFSLHQGDLTQRTEITLSAPPQLDGATALYRVRLRPREQWRLRLVVSVTQQEGGRILERPLVPATPAAPPRQNSAATGGGDRPLYLETDDLDLQLAFRRALADLQALEIETPAGHRLIAAGLPWFVAVFGRDSLITAFQTLLLGQDRPAGTLRALAAYQATQRDDFHDAEPGKFPHEIRHGRLARLGRVPHARYYGTVDATPLWLVLLSETYRWSGDLSLVRSLLPNVEAALRWIDESGDLDGDGFVEYQRRSAEGLENQGWKDSWDSIRFADGRLADGPIALVEVQGYVYDAKVRTAELFEALGQHQRAAELRQQAGRLKAAFNDAFWMPAEGYFALALDRRKRPVDGISSNPGHALWSGIVDERYAGAVAERLVSEELFSGWGIRTLSTAMRGYHPVSYHNGSVWPHDTGLVAAGLARYGFRTEAARVLRGLLDASAGFAEHRLPELFAGYARRPGGFPVAYPDANAPQAWAAGSVVLALQTLLGIQAEGRELTTQALPGAPHCTLVGVSHGGRRLSLQPTAEHRRTHATSQAPNGRAP